MAKKTVKAKVVESSGRIKIHCPIHKNEEMHRLGFNVAVSIKKSKKNKRGLTGSRHSTQWFFCQKCDKPRKIEFVVAN